MADSSTEMRLDVYLARTRLVMPREAARRACDNGIVYVNDRLAKPSATVRAGDRVTIRFTDEDLAIRVVRLPGKSVPKKEAAGHYEVLEQRRYR